jgi:predicted methyltransferase
MGAGAGYSTELMARSVGTSCKVYGQVEEESDKLRSRMTGSVMSNVTVLVRPSGDPVPSDIHDLDLITFYFAYHDTTYTGTARAKMNRAMFAALKPGGLLVIADHSAGLKMAPQSARPIIALPSQRYARGLRRRDSKFVADAGFLRHSEDARTSIVFRDPTPVDEFVLKFQKPM